MKAQLRSLLKSIITSVRSAFRGWPVEPFLAKRTQGKALSSFWVRLIPNIELYKKASIREVVRNGIRYRLDISDYNEYVIYFGIDVESRQPLYDRVRNGMTILDVGTNMGETILNLAKINPAGKVYGFEPVPFLYEKTQVNLGLNSFKNISVHQLAISDSRGKLYFEVPANRNSGSISMSTKPGPGSTIVEATTIDDFVREQGIPAVDLIKVDVEGFESRVIHGARETIAKHAPILYIEVVDSYLRSKGSSAAFLLEAIRGMGYEIRDPETCEAVRHMEDLPEGRSDILCLPVANNRDSRPL